MRFAFSALAGREIVLQIGVVTCYVRQSLDRRCREGRSPQICMDYDARSIDDSPERRRSFARCARLQPLLTLESQAGCELSFIGCAAGQGELAAGELTPDLVGNFAEKIAHPVPAELRRKL